ncbi:MULTISPECIES: tyrosine-type recombinase/integrase [Mycobacterium]|jgi:integrase|uniref:Integrase n=2 Tax=Mycolicibacterium senegalense TaxID=1796 RepID=A0ABR5FMU8_9MYCO|nr:MULTISPECIES: site-specific integrase [unclassified Mycobacterium avium complex (MAC)]KLI09378.1 integrase [Mycolicibacterium senegalense]KLO47770.1 integrase [Mycolicibacterium senegalense]OKH66216.1 integrase [Mycobacterium sp. SWH-M3]
MGDPDGVRNLAVLVVPDVGRLEATGDRWVPFRMLDANGISIEPVAAFFAELQAADRRPGTIRSYGHDLLRWWRFLAAVGVDWDRATSIEGRDFARWMMLADKPVRVHWRHRDGNKAAAPAPSRRDGGVNAVTGKPEPSSRYASSTRVHAEAVLRSFYDFQIELGRGPLVNPFPLDRSRRPGRRNAHRNPLDAVSGDRAGRYRPRRQRRIPKSIPDDQFNRLFADLRTHRDRALLAFWVSTGARADELLSTTQFDVDPGQQLIRVTRKGSRAVQWLPASQDAFVWLRLYQEQVWKRGAPRGKSHPLWLTLRRPWRPVSYPAARAMFSRTQDALGSNWTIHDLRHTAATRMSNDPEMSITDVQWVLGHAHLTTTQIYTTPTEEDVVARTLAHQRRVAAQPSDVAPPAAGYHQQSLDVLFSRGATR